MGLRWEEGEVAQVGDKPGASGRGEFSWCRDSILGGGQRTHPQRGGE